MTFAGFYRQFSANPVADHAAALPRKQVIVSKEGIMNWNKGVRQVHRWLSIAFTLTVAANFLALALGGAPMWLVYLPLPPLFLLMFSGLYMFARPYLTKARNAAGPA